MEIEKDTDLPRNLVKKIVKNKVSQVQASTGAQQGRDVQVNKDALLAFSESAKVFISYLTSAANDICKDAKRQTISADDVFTALQDLDFGELINPTKEALEAFRQESKEKNRRKAEQAKKRKAEEAERQAAQDEPEDAAAAAPAADGAAGDAGHPPANIAQAVQAAPQQPYVAQAHTAYQKPPEHASTTHLSPAPQAQQQTPASANTFQQALSQAGLPFNQAIGQQAAQFAAALAQAQQASQLLPQQFNPTQLPVQFPGAQLPQGFPLAGQINQANYAQFAAVLAQQAARQRQAQGLAAPQTQRPQQVQPTPGIVQQHFQSLQQQQQQQQQAAQAAAVAPSANPQPAEQAATRESNMQGDGQAQAFQ